MSLKDRIYLLLILAAALCAPAAPAQEVSPFREVNTSRGRVVTGITKEKALQEFGVPDSVSGELWHYLGPPQRFVYFASRSLLDIFLYPTLVELSSGGVPVEVKAFGYFSDHTVKDITQAVEFIVSQKQDIATPRPGIFIPSKEGQYQVIASLGGVVSNASYILLRKEEEKKEEAKENCLAVYILPHRPVVRPANTFGVVALGVFFSEQEKGYLVRNVSRQCEWFIEQDRRAEEVSLAENNVIRAPGTLGRYTLFCKYHGLKSVPQQLFVDEQGALGSAQEIRHITLLPEFLFTQVPNNVNLRAFATYGNNGVDEITARVRWRVSDEEALIALGNGAFSARAEGVVEVAAFAGVESPVSKLIIARPPEEEKARQEQQEDMVGQTSQSSSESKDEGKKDEQRLMEEIKKESEELQKSASEKKKELVSVILTPDYLKIHMGEEGAVVATANYSDGSQEEVTLFCDWQASDDKIIQAERGKVRGLAKGEAKLSAAYKGITSAPATIIVEGAKLVSITIVPAVAEVPIGRSFQLAAEGYYSDASRKDITAQASWEASDQRILNVRKGRVYPRRMGETQVFASYLEVRSLPANVKVKFSLIWFLLRLLLTLALLCGAMGAFFVFLYALTERQKKRLKRLLQEDPRRFIVELHENAVALLPVFAFRPRAFVAPLGYAALADEAFPNEKGLFLRLTAKYEEAKFSSHPLAVKDALSALDLYNDFFKVVVRLRSVRKTAFALAYAATLLKTRPLLIPS